MFIKKIAKNILLNYNEFNFFSEYSVLLNVMDGRDRNFGVDFLFLFFDFFLKSLDLPDISITDLLVTCTSLPADTWNFKPSSCFHERCENCRVTDGHFGKKCNF